MRTIQGAMVKASANAVRTAPRFCFEMNQIHKRASPAKRRMTERVRAVRPRKMPESRKLRVVGFSLDLRRKKKEVRSRRKKGFSVPRPRG